ncbi:FixH family protein [Hydrogenimonas thermophila]|uniref:FixH family protein n=1 Tax=Hydrogenimonas thermophila TaxID=223786 RepID=UPI0029371913|nr:FixH family protein [Hydrogenimonas thermophila]WOE70089.1 FixH family protein [Hydrogenimonas thermophila]WOE72606.1 FixH family protein [Hydrogenimonas thermophila]
MQQNNKKEINYWPYAIVGMILTVVILGIWTIKVAVNNPVQLDNSYMMKYQDVDENINEIMAKQKLFDLKYQIDLSSNKLKIGKNKVVVNLISKDSNIINNPEITVVVTRPTTTQYDIHLNNFEFNGKSYISEEFELKNGGRWNIEVRVKIGEDIGYKTYKLFVK